MRVPRPAPRGGRRPSRPVPVPVSVSVSSRRGPGIPGLPRTGGEGRRPEAGREGGQRFSPRGPRSARPGTPRQPTRTRGRVSGPPGLPRRPPAAAGAARQNRPTSRFPGPASAFGSAPFAASEALPWTPRPLSRGVSAGRLSPVPDPCLLFFCPKRATLPFSVSNFISLASAQPSGLAGSFGISHPVLWDISRSSSFGVLCKFDRRPALPILSRETLSNGRDEIKMQ